MNANDPTIARALLAVQTALLALDTASDASKEAREVAATAADTLATLDASIVRHVVSNARGSKRWKRLAANMNRATLKIAERFAGAGENPTVPVYGDGVTFQRCAKILAAAAAEKARKAAEKAKRDEWIKQGAERERAAALAAATADSAAALAPAAERDAA